MTKFVYLPEFARLTSPPATPTAGFNRPHYNSTLNCSMDYDAVRAKWLSTETFTFTVSRAGNIGAGISLQISGGSIPTSTSPLHLGTSNTCLVSVRVTTGDTESFVLGVSDISIGGSATAYTIAIPSGIDFADDTVNQNFTANDTIDIFISSLNGTGNINNPVVTLTFRKRA